MKAVTYATALKRLVADGGDEKKLGDSLIAHLKERGRLKLLPGILAELTADAAKQKKFAPLVEVASEKESAAALKGALAAGIPATHSHVNHSLIRGWRVRTKNALVDRSGKRALVDLYQKIAKA